MSGRRTESTRALLGTALHQTSDHVGKTLALARTEIDGNLRGLFGFLALLAVCVLLVLMALFLFLGALVKALAAVISSEAWAAVIVAAPFLTGTAVLTRLGLRRMAPPNRTSSTLER